MSQELITVETLSLGQIANQYASQNVFTDYQERTAENTLRRQKADLALFAKYLECAGMCVDPNELLNNPSSWSDITHGLVDGFIRWQLQQGYAIGSINVHLSTVKKYCSLATRAGTLSLDELGKIKLVEGYSQKEGRNVDATREKTRIGHKKAEAISLSSEQAKQLKQQPDTAQGRRDAFLVCLLLDHGLRCGEIEGLTPQSINLTEGTLVFYREKVDKTQTHKLTNDTLLAAMKYFQVCTPSDSLLMGSRKGGKLEGRMSERAITARVEELCQRIGIKGASAHDGRHCWSTLAVKGGTDIKSLQDAGGWSSPAMPLRYVNSARIANEGVNLG